jgi:GGDEF domain-containing protein
MYWGYFFNLPEIGAKEPNSGRQSLAYSVSIGTSLSGVPPASVEELEVLIEQADAHMYHDKQRPGG